MGKEEADLAKYSFSMHIFILWKVIFLSSYFIFLSSYHIPGLSIYLPGTPYLPSQGLTLPVANGSIWQSLLRSIWLRIFLCIFHLSVIKQIFLALFLKLGRSSTWTSPKHCLKLYAYCGNVTCKKHFVCELIVRVPAQQEKSKLYGFVLYCIQHFFFFLILWLFSLSKSYPNIYETE